MARRSRRGLADDLFDIAVKLPWWASIGIALASYVVLHSMASTPAPTAAGTADIGRVASHGLFATLAGFGQYIVPLIFLVGAGASALQRAKGVRLFDEVAARDSVEALRDMSWREFEQLVGEAFRRQGYGVVRKGGDGPDGGVDLVLTRDGEKTLVQCKQWRAQRVGVSVVRELYGVMAAERAAAGIVVTAGGFTPDANEFANGRKMRLIDGDELYRLIAGVRSDPAWAATAPPGGSDSSAPTCPRCGGTMVRREARRGTNAGTFFWGCRRYPECRGTRDSV
jgi:restriction system protein